MYDDRVKRLMAIPGNSNKMLPVGTKKALDCLRIHSVVRTQGDLKLLAQGGG